MDRYEEKKYWRVVEDSVRQEILRELYERWDNNSQGNCIFVSATERENLEGLRNVVLEK